MQLNLQQQKAVKHQAGPLLIIAGAGTGKTTVITQHIKHLVQTQKVSAQSIFAVTFTDKSAKEMLDRLDVVMPMGYEEPWLGTFHGLCDRLLKGNALEVGLDPNYKIITPTDQWILIKKHLFAFNLKYYRPLGNPSKFISALLKFFSRCQDEDVTPEKLTLFATSKKKTAKNDEEVEVADKLIELAAAFHTYQELKIAESVFDFGDLITQTLNLLRQRPSILKRYQTQFAHILVDEFQDTNFAQYQLIKLLAPPTKNPNLIVVGDDDQAIYKFRGAAISNILNFKKDYPKTKSVVLTQNFRSIQSILDSAYQLIQNNNPDRLEASLKINKHLISKRIKKTHDFPQIIKTPTQEVEVDTTIKKILELVSVEKYTYKDFAILARSNSQLDAYVSGLKRSSIPYQLVGNRGLFDQEEVRVLTTFLRVIADTDDSISLFHFLHFEPLDIPADQLLNLLNESRKKRTSLWEVLQDTDLEPITKVINLIKTAQEKSLHMPVTKILHQFIQTTGYVKTLIQSDILENQLKIKNLNLFFDRVKQYETQHKPAHVTDFVDTLKLWEEAGENPAQAVIEDIDTISLLTVHSAKGLEFPVVFVCGLVAGRFPSPNRKDAIEFPEELIAETLPQGSSEIQEERRLLYVALTRAKDYLYLTYAGNYGGVRPRHPSGFLNETNLPEIVNDPEPLDQTVSAPESKPIISYLSGQGQVDIKTLSYSQIDTFLTCPLKYKYRYILKIPSEPHHALSFGQTIHNTLHDFHRLEQQGRIMTLEELTNLYKHHFIELGYESIEHKQEQFAAGQTALEKYYELFKNVFGTPKMLERKFSLHLAGITLIGKIDRIDETPDGIEIIDYKTGSPKDQKAVDRDRQLTIYGLASKEALGLEANKLSLFFLNTGEKVTTTRTSKQYEKDKAWLENTINKIKNSDFPAEPNYPFPCKFCEYNKICPFAKKQ